MLMARSIFLFSTFLTAVCVPHFDLLMGLTGSLTGALLSFIFPCIFHINIKKLKLEYYQVFFDIVILLMGTVCSVTGVYRSGKIRKKNFYSFRMALYVNGEIPSLVTVVVTDLVTKLATSMLPPVGDRFEMLVTDSLH